MFEKSLIMYIYAETPIHVGSGVTLGIVDLPIQRERHTEFPIIQGSSIKGVLRNSVKDVLKNSAEDVEVENIDKNIIDTIFGKEDHIGGISVSDAKVLAFPVRTLKGVFGWITCPLVLDKYKRDLSLAKINVDWEIPKPSSNEEAIVCKDSNIVECCVYIEDLQLECNRDENINKIAEEISKALPDDNAYKEIKEKLKKDLVIVSDEIFRDLVTLTTEVVTRIKINPETGTVETGGLWSEEYLPSDTLMYSLILIPCRLNNNVQNVQNEIVEYIMKYNKKILQIGGDETIGKGFARIKIVEGDRNVEKS